MKLFICVFAACIVLTLLVHGPPVDPVKRKVYCVMDIKNHSPGICTYSVSRDIKDAAFIWDAKSMMARTRLHQFVFMFEDGCGKYNIGDSIYFDN